MEKRLTKLINADNLQLCLAALKKPSTAKQSCKFPVINDVIFQGELVSNWLYTEVLKEDDLRVPTFARQSTIVSLREHGVTLLI